MPGENIEALRSGFAAMNERDMSRILRLTVNGRAREDAVADDLLLVDYLRSKAALTGTKQGCDGGECGACTVLIDGEPQLACITLAARCEGKRPSASQITKTARHSSPLAWCTDDSTIFSSSGPTTATSSPESGFASATSSRNAFTSS